MASLRAALPGASSGAARGRQRPAPPPPGAPAARRRTGAAAGRGEAHHRAAVAAEDADRSRRRGRRRGRLRLQLGERRDQMKGKKVGHTRMLAQGGGNQIKSRGRRSKAGACQQCRPRGLGVGGLTDRVTDKIDATTQSGKERMHRAESGGVVLRQAAGG